MTPAGDDLLAVVAEALAAVAGYGAVTVDAVTRELGWSVERRREVVGRALGRLVHRGLAAAPDDAWRGGAGYPVSVYGLTAGGRRWLAARRFPGR